MRRATVVRDDGRSLEEAAFLRETEPYAFTKLDRRAAWLLVETRAEPYWTLFPFEVLQLQEAQLLTLPVRKLLVPIYLSAAGALVALFALLEGRGARARQPALITAALGVSMTLRTIALQQGWLGIWVGGAFRIATAIAYISVPLGLFLTHAFYRWTADRPWTRRALLLWGAPGALLVVLGALLDPSTGTAPFVQGLDTIYTLANFGAFARLASPILRNSAPGERWAIFAGFTALVGGLALDSVAVLSGQRFVFDVGYSSLGLFVQALSQGIVVASRNARAHAEARENADLAARNASLARDISDRSARAFHRFVPEDSIRLLGGARFEDLRAGLGVRRDLTVLFADIRNFTTRSETMPPEQVFAFVNECLGGLAPVVHAHGGFIDKFIGDAIMAIFPGDPASAVAAATDFRRKVTAFNAKQPGGTMALAIGVGIHRGPVVLGTVGHDDRLEVTAIGDAVNVAARLESLTKDFGVGALVSDAVTDGSDSNTYRRVGKVHVKGRHAPVTLFEVLACTMNDDEREEKARSFRSFAAGLAAFEGALMDDSVRHFAQAVDQAPRDAVARRYLERASRYLREGVPAGFDGSLALGS